MPHPTIIVKGLDTFTGKERYSTPGDIPIWDANAPARQELAFLNVETVTINHGLVSPPNITMIDTAGTVLYPSIQHNTT